MDFKSLTAGGEYRSDVLNREFVPRLIEEQPMKFYWFLSHGYAPHVWQSLFHGAKVDGKINAFRHLVAGRRGGKTLSAAWEVLFYALHPKEFHRDAHGLERDRPLWIWALAKDYRVGRPSLTTFLEVIRQVGLVKDRDYRYNRTEKIFEFYGPGEELLSTVEFRSADDPQNLRGAGLDILWIDEAAFIANREAWDVVFPALTDREGIVITTTTPNGKNWLWELFFSGESLEDVNQFRVEYTSIDNPYFPKRMWEYALKHYHPVMFRQEFMAAFDAMAGVALQGDWLKYFVFGNPDIQTDDVGIPRDSDGKYALDTYIGVDPAISLADAADSFAMALIGVTKDRTQVYLLDYYVGKITFPDQLDKIREWSLKFRPHQIGIESNAYQRALVQMTARVGLPAISAIMSKGKKEDRILGMGPLFKVGQVRIAKRHAEFIDQWVSYDPAKKNQHDDLLDAVEIALGVAGVLLPVRPDASLFGESRGDTIWDTAQEQLQRAKDRQRAYDPELGTQA